MSFSLCKYKFLWNQHLTDACLISSAAVSEQSMLIRLVSFLPRVATSLPLFYHVFWQSVPTLIINIFRHSTSNFFQRALGHQRVFANGWVEMEKSGILCDSVVRPGLCAPLLPPCHLRGWILHINLSSLIFSINPPHCPQIGFVFKASGDRSEARWGTRDVDHSDSRPVSSWDNG